MVGFVYFALGGFVGWFIAHLYYLKAGKQLKEAAEELRRLSTLILKGLESAGLVKWSKDENDRIIGITFQLHASPGAVTVTGHNPEVTAG